MNVEANLKSHIKLSQDSALAYDQEWNKEILQPLFLFEKSAENLNFEQVQELLVDEAYIWEFEPSLLDLVCKKIFFDRQKLRISFVIPKPKNIPDKAREILLPMIRGSNSGSVVAFFTPTTLIWLPSNLYWLFNPKVEINLLFSELGRVKSGVRIALPDGFLGNLQSFVEWTNQELKQGPLFREEFFQLNALAVRTSGSSNLEDGQQLFSWKNTPLTKLQSLEALYWSYHVENFERITRQFSAPEFLLVLSQAFNELEKRFESDAQNYPEAWSQTSESLRIFLAKEEKDNSLTYFYDNFVLNHDNAHYLYFGMDALYKTGDFGEIADLEFNNVLQLLRSLCILAASSPRLTDMGKRFPFFSPTASGLGYLELLTVCPEKPERYWIGESLGFWWLDDLLTENEYPLTSQGFVEGFKDVQLTRQESEELRETHELLFAEAAAMKEFFIPPNAFVEVGVGPFVGVKIHERENDIALKWVTQRNEFFSMSMWPEDKAFAFQSFGELKFLQEEAKKVYGAKDDVLIENALSQSNQIDKLVAAKQLLSLISATIIRDFWVVDERKDVFYVQEKATKRTAQKNQKPTSSSKKQIVYIPRRRYSKKIDLSKFQKRLKLAERTKHIVRQHFRKGQPTAAQIQLAKLMNIQLPEGHTFVKSHFRGGGEAQKVYRSISAIALAATSEEPTIEKINDFPTWFDFENEVGRIQKLMGYEVLFKAANYSGDGGIDLRVRKKTSKRIEEVLIQCKCWKGTVGPDVVRELMGTLVENQNDEVDLRGAIYTTSKFSKEATALAVKNNIQLVDGDTWAKLSNQMTYN